MSTHDRGTTQLRVPGRGRRAAGPGQACIHELFEAQAKAAPEAEALVCAGERLSYDQLNGRANGIAHRLRSLGAGPETIVGILMERSPAMVAAMLGVLKAGAAYLPLDPSYPWPRLAFMLADSGAAILLTERAMAGVIPGAALRPFAILSLDEDGGISQADTRNLGAEVRTSHLAYVIYTSGSTGQPKAVAVEHRNTAALISWAAGVYGRTELGGVFAGVSICFDPSILDLFVPLCLGGKVILGANTLELPRCPAKEEVRLINTVPSVMQELIRLGGIPASLETVNLGGEPLSTQLVGRIYGLGHVRRVYDLYGPTECSTCSTFALRRPGEPATIGRPIAQTQVHLLGEDLRPVPPGATGEVFIGGAGVARGYINRPELTAEKFLHLSLGEDPPCRVYRTGDLCRANARGELEFVGRKDEQVKIRGFRVELGEIESAVLAHPEVAATAVVAHEDRPGEQRLVAYLAPRANGSQPGADMIPRVRSHLESRLPPYMVPAIFIVVDRFALTPNGKLDRRALPPLARSRDGAGEFRAPAGGTEDLLCGIWKTFLDLEEIGVDDDFFHLGGDSLAFTVMLARVEEKTGVKLPLGSILQARTIRRLAGFIAKASNRPAPEVAVPPAAGPRWFEIQPQGARTPFYLVHGLGGGMLWGYVTLGRHLGEDRPIYAFRNRASDRNGSPETIESIAARYVADLLGRQPAGPYILGGYCFGGNVAFEMARQLEAGGRRVDLVVLINSIPHNSAYQRFRLSPGQTGRFLLNFGRWVHGYSQLNRLRRRRLARWKIGVLKRRTGRWLRPGRDPADLGDRIDLSAIPEEERFLWESHVAALAGHRTGPYGGKVLLFRARAHPLISSYDPQNGWGEFVRGGVTVHLIPSLHETLLEEPYVEAIARELKPRLDALEEPNGAAARGPGV